MKKILLRSDTEIYAGDLLVLMINEAIN